MVLIGDPHAFFELLIGNCSLLLPDDVRRKGEDGLGQWPWLLERPDLRKEVRGSPIDLCFDSSVAW